MVANERKNGAEPAIPENGNQVGAVSKTVERQVSSPGRPRFHKGPGDGPPCGGFHGLRELSPNVFCGRGSNSRSHI